MISREDIREGIAQILDLSVDDYYRTLPDCSLEDIAETLIQYLKSQGLVKKVEGELPSIFDGKDEMKTALEYREDMAGYCKWEEL